MKFATFSSAGETFWGTVGTNGVIALSPDFPQYRTLRDVIEAGALGAVGKAAEGRAVTHPDGSFQWEIPVPDPEKIICVGVNFPDRNAEYKDGQDAPPNMSLFIRFPRSFVGHEQPLRRPPKRTNWIMKAKSPWSSARAGGALPRPAPSTTLRH